ncbi:hypothetical protein UFOVP874_5 [uncultured Caudovirales phage]|uniref:Uncharacterized protein n=1 Tax=uncultured Caudovirales phage TaxID=2100421 RepID=A0A6J5PG93_9CAUD|nr:hypothetical protein UFOVP874_5 [uncultured Caudovirales phage]
MISFTKPQNLNGAELLEELAAAGVKVEGKANDNGEGSLFLDIDAANESKVAAIVAAHNGTMKAKELTPEEKLFNATGLTVAEYKTLGL